MHHGAHGKLKLFHLEDGGFNHQRDYKYVLPTLQAIIEKVRAYHNFNLEKIILVCVQHLVFTTVDLIESLIILGAKPKNIHIMGKIYSTCSKVEERIIQMGVVYHASLYPQQLGCFKDH